MASSSFPRPGHNGGQVTNYEHQLLAGKATADGVHGHPTDALPAYADPTGVRTVRVESGLGATIQGSAYQSGATDITLPQLTANTSGAPRIDTVVLRLNRSDWTISEQVITGVPAQNPAAPALIRNTGSTGFYDLPLIDVRVNHGAANIDNSFVTRRCWYIGSDGQLRCTPTTRPPHEAGRVAWDTTYGWILSTGGRWITAAEDTGPLAWTMQSGFVANGNTVHRRNGWAFADLTFRRPTAGMNGGTAYTVARLPEGFRPPWTYQTNAHCPSAQVNLTVAVYETGYINVNPGVDVPPNRAIVLDALNHPVAL